MSLRGAEGVRGAGARAFVEMHTSIQAYMYTDIQTVIQTDRQTDRQTDFGTTYIAIYPTLRYSLFAALLHATTAAIFSPVREKENYHALKRFWERSLRTTVPKLILKGTGMMTTQPEHPSSRGSSGSSLHCQGTSSIPLAA